MAFRSTLFARYLALFVQPNRRYGFRKCTGLPKDWTFSTACPNSRDGGAYRARLERMTSAIAVRGWSAQVAGRIMRLWQKATARPVSGSAQPSDPPAPGTQMVL